MSHISHHGILGQKWGSRNGPPYPLGGGDYSASEKRAIYTKRRLGNSIYNKKHFDEVLKSDKTTLSTLSYDKDRTKGTDMFYATHMVFIPTTFSKKTFNSPEIKMSKVNKPEDVLKTLASNGNGAYGNLTVQWIFGSGHSVFWKNENGKTRIYDGQSGDEYTQSYLSSMSFMNRIDLSNVTYNRLDNCDPTDYALAIVERNDK